MQLYITPRVIEAKRIWKGVLRWLESYYQSFYALC